MAAKGLLDVRVDGAEGVKISFDLTNERIKNRVREAVHQAARELKAQALQNVSSHRKTGNLSRNVTDVGRDTDWGIYWKVGTAPDGYYGRFLEKGVNGPVNVKSYNRAKKHGEKMQTVKTVWKSVRAEGPRAMGLNKKTGKMVLFRRPTARVMTFKKGKVYDAGFVTVKAHVRNRKMQAYPWLAPALEAVAPGFRAAIKAIAESPED